MFHHQIKFFISFGREREEITNPTGPLLGLGTLASIVNDQEVLFTSERHTKSSAMVAKQDIFLCFMFLLASYESYPIELTSFCH